MKSRVAPFLITALFLAPLVARPALAATPAQQAEELVRRGNALRSAGDDQGALPIFQRAYELHRSPRTAVQLGLAEYALGRWADADEHLTEALRSAETDTFIQKNRKDIEDWLRTVKKQVGRVEVTGEPAGAEVLVNGRVVGKVPLGRPIAVSAGSVDIELRSPGFKSAFRTLTLMGGQYQPVVMRLEREAGPERAGEAPPAAPAPPVAGEVAESAAAPDPGTGTWRKWAVVAAVGAAAVGAGVGAYGVLRHDSKVDDFDDANCREHLGKPVSGTTGMADPKCTTRYNEMSSAKRLAIVGFSAAGALAATALILHLTAPDPRPGAEYAHRSRPICVPDLLGRRVSCALRF